MKKIFFLPIFLLSIVACQSQHTTEVAQQAATSTAKAVSPEPTFKVPFSYKGTIPESGLPIPTDYPYAIDLTDADRKALNSANVFKKNGKPTLKLNALKEKYPIWKEETDFNLYAISTDFPKNYERFIKRVKDSEWPFETYHDTKRVFADRIPGNLNGLPQVFIYDAEGKIVYHRRKYVPGDEDALYERVKSML